MAPSRVPTGLTTLLRRTIQHQKQHPHLQSLCCPILRRSYQSYDHPPAPGVFGAAEQAILSAAYRHVPEHGFTQHALSLGARDAGYLDISTNLLPEGPFSLIRYHLVTQREALTPQSELIFHSRGEEKTYLPQQVLDKVERLTWERLLGNQEVNHRWQEALAIMAQPPHVPASLRELALLADDIYYLAGDTSVDSSWYTKRGSLSMIYASSELFMTNDRSAGFGETRAFLQRRLDETNNVGGAWGSFAQWVSFTASAGVNVLRSKGFRI
ncbi:ubiquinone biosynthesis protein COQ9 [Annulohypoxylon maeteangense]|uniref:ubiquinone biosynthesis protein COQ9 n=1 Tax=Annulohypoxylon maeteangense TaxID=1927788 RepID=UPI0020081108|nr:ubiquinone biosynthesis protein COQ9 [Annulohypoxylon maeteangense]KAI0880998.1 ubiquinone biosynthesis protein COQ9 [Annulohypoxylon maeteangense]